uniref:Uncharacterized protein n=1 Tax=Anguilla anguilla TaxID=7936 RepID=A0A0E9T7R9_ANGAN
MQMHTDLYRAGADTDLHYLGQLSVIISLTEQTGCD